MPALTQNMSTALSIQTRRVGLTSLCCLPLTHILTSTCSKNMPANECENVRSYEWTPDTE